MIRVASSGLRLCSDAVLRLLCIFEIIGRDVDDIGLFLVVCRFATRRIQAEYLD